MFTICKTLLMYLMAVLQKSTIKKKYQSVNLNPLWILMKYTECKIVTNYIIIKAIKLL